MKKKVAIIGAGIAGLTLASLLNTNSDFEFVIYEKEENLNLDEGFGIQLAVNGVSILNQIGFDKIDKNEKYHPSKLDFYSTNCNKVCDLDLSIFNSSNEKYTTLKRSVLIKFLKEKLLTNSIIFNKKINDFKKVNEKIYIRFVDGTNDEVDYLVIADGVYSNTKSVIEKKFSKPNYYGAIAIRAQISTQDILNFNSDNISIIMGSNSHLVLYPVNSKKEINLVCIIRKKLQDKDSIKTIVENKILKDNKKLANFFKGDLKSWSIYTTLKPIKSNHKNVFYIGDAFYAFPPTLAQGASQSIEAANEIFNLLINGHPDIQNKYFEKRVERINVINKRAKFNYFGFHISNPLLKILRNQLLKYIVKNKKFIQAYIGRIYN